MKKMTLSLVTVFIAVNFSFAQTNTFPSSGNVGIGTINPQQLLNINSGATPTASQFRVTSNGLGSLSALNYSQDNISIGFDVDFSSGGWTARSPNVAWLYKTNGFFLINGSAGNTIGGAATANNLFAVNLSNGNVGIGTSSPGGVLQITNNVPYADNPANQLVLTNGGYRNSESGGLPVDNAGIAYYFTNYNAGGKWYDRTLDIKVRGAADGTYGAGMIRFFANNYTAGSPEREIMRIHGNGNVGIGTTSPTGQLSLTNLINNTSNSNNPINYSATSNVNGQSVFNSYYVGNPDGSGPYPRYLDIAAVGQPDGTNGGSDIRFLTNPITLNAPAVERMRISSNGNVGIGTTTPGAYMLAVNGNVHARQVNVDITGWGDYVFKRNYVLPTLAELKTYIDKNHHLPDVPSEQEMVKNGLDVAEMNKLLVKKVEELTLYLIENDKTVKGQSAQLKSQQEQINRLQEQLDHLLKNSGK